MQTHCRKFGRRPTELGRKTYRVWAEDLQDFDGRPTELGRKTYRAWTEDLQGLGNENVNVFAGTNDVILRLPFGRSNSTKLRKHTAIAAKAVTKLAKKSQHADFSTC